jgi:CRISPR-associated endonuclease/helicase Cas3
MAFKLKSHPDILLADHLQICRETGLSLMKKHGLFTEYQVLMEIVLLFHDLGKASHYFQDYLSGNKVNDKFKKHAEISALWAFFLIRVQTGNDLKSALLAYLLIRRHHGEIKNFEDNFVDDLEPDDLIRISQKINYEELKLIYKPYLNTDKLSHQYFEDFLSQERESFLYSFAGKNKAWDFQDYFLVNYLFSILIYSDKQHAIFEKQISREHSHYWQSAYVLNFKNSLKRNENVMTSVREDAYRSAEKHLDSDKSIFSLNLPTGAGKTLNAINLALKLKESIPTIERIIYCLPFTSIIDQNEKVFANILEHNQILPESDLLLKNHHLSDLNYYIGNELQKEKESEFLIETWESQLVVTTFYQLLHSLLSNQNRALRKFHNISNSVIILDEIQAVPHKYWFLIKETLKRAVSLMNCKIILVTATMPLIFDEKKHEITELATDKISYFKKLDRIDLNLSMFKQAIEMSRLLEYLDEQISRHQHQSQLIILNTIKSAKEVCEGLKERFPDREVLFLSSHVIPLHRLKLIDDVKTNPTGKIVVSTQLIEAGVDIDMDFVYRDFAPLDSVFQSCGRCNRNNSKDKSQVFLFELLDKKGKPLHAYVYDHVLTDHTRRCLDQKESVPESDFYHLAEEYYQGLNELSSHTVSDQLIRKISSLSYETAFSFQEKEAFKLIDSLQTCTVFIEYDHTACEIYQRYQDLKENQEMDTFEKKTQLKKVFREMAPYMINLQKKYCEGNEEFFYISYERKDTYYSLETGFKLTQEAEDYII